MLGLVHTSCSLLLIHSITSCLGLTAHSLVCKPDISCVSVSHCLGSSSHWPLSTAAAFCRLEDLPATVEAADNMLEHLGAIEAARSSLDCFEVLGMQHIVKQQLQLDFSGQMSVKECLHFIKSAL